LQVDAERELAERRREIEKEGERLRTEAKREADKAREDARVEAVKVTEEARKKATERIEAAEKAADETVRDAEAISRGLRSLASVLEQQAEILLRDVQAGHRRMRAELRVASGAGPGGGSALPREPREPSASGGRRRGRGTPLEDIEVPSWVGPE
jgi:cell division septum initiation protein DivIVA